jgi:hypothetical protein
MARRVFFSFHYERDVRRIQQVRQSWVVRPGDEAQPFFDAAAFEEAKTDDREWVRHEIKRSYELGKGILAIDIHNVRDPQSGVDVPGANPLGYWSIERGGRKVYFTELYKSYDWVRDDGYHNMPAWIEAAAAAAKP